MGMSRMTRYNMPEVHYQKDFSKVFVFNSFKLKSVNKKAVYLSWDSTYFEFYGIKSKEYEN